MKKRVLLTGGAGFIGSHLSTFLLERDFEIICMDNLITGVMGNISHLSKNKHFEFIEHDVTKYIDIKGNIDYVLHFASPASPVDYLKLPIQTLKVGSLGTHNALGVAKEKGAKFLLASTSEIYGDPAVHPQPESYWGNVNNVGPRGVYDESKRFAEAITMAYHRTHRLDTKIVRIFNTYGPRMRKVDGRAIPAFIEEALNNKPITVFGDGKQTRSFCYISDLVEGVYRLMNSSVNTPVNIGSPEEMTILKLADVIIDLTKSKSKIIFESLPIDDPKTRQPEITLARMLLSWNPTIKLEEGLAKTIEWFKATYM
ncbi:MAG: SDR family oxidoreductase [Candidatus Omnitrophica bacterium]|nr:SDR family oxidoreductase [Candidatus Omnitrophota bacterium]MCG2705120.1 SDR family oxidoreductase [Candidatus Omnitrophota bacterium]